jgi:hypothetical protein
MFIITRKNLTESLTLLIPHRLQDGEGGYEETWTPGPRLWAAVFPTLGRKEKPHYHLAVGGRLILPYKMRFLWEIEGMIKRLSPITAPRFIQNKRFLSMTVREETHA